MLAKQREELAQASVESSTSKPAIESTEAKATTDEEAAKVPVPELGMDWTSQEAATMYQWEFIQKD